MVLERGAARGQLRMSTETATRIVMAAVERVEIHGDVRIRRGIGNVGDVRPVRTCISGVVELAVGADRP